MFGQRERRQVTSAEILLVEDDAGDALLVEELLADAAPDYEPVWVTSVAEAENRITARTLCILLDLGLPDSEGLEGLRRALRMAGRIPVIVLTGRVDRDLGEAAVAEGAQDYLVKGTVSGEELVRSVLRDQAGRLHLVHPGGTPDRRLLLHDREASPTLNWV